MTLRDQIAQQAMTLPSADREYVADLLERSLPAPAEEFRSGEIAEAWSQEIDRRIAAYDRGETTAVDFDTALEGIRQALETHQSHKTAQGRLPSADMRFSGFSRLCRPGVAISS